MARSLREWIGSVASLGLLREVKGVDWNLEIGAITDLNVKRNRYTLLFDEIKGYPRGYRLLTGALLDSKRVGLALGLGAELSDMELVRALKDRLSSASVEIENYRARQVSDAPLFENSLEGSKVDMFKFPAPKWYENDGGRYLGTADAVITKDPETGWINVGTYRIMLQERDLLSVFIEAPRHGRFQIKKYWDMGEPCPVVVSFGHHPSIQIFAGMEVPPGVSELDFVGAITREPYEVVKGPITGLPIPADSELAIEGYIINEPRPEGPFGEFIGYYASGESESPVIKVEALYFRDEPIMLGTCSGRPPHDYTYWRCAVRAALIWDILEKAGVQGVVGVWCHEAGYSRAFTVVSVRQMFGGHVRMAGHIASQCRPGAVAGRYVVVVDDDIDPTNLNDVIWAMCSRSDPAEIEIIRESLGTPLDPIADHDEYRDILEYTSNRGIIYATKPFKKLIRGEFPKVVEPSPELVREVLSKRAELFN